MWYEKLEDNKVYCQLCPHECRFGPGRSGICRVRKNYDGILMATNYGKAGAYAVDPIEKKPLYHFYPGTYVVSVGARGCNFKCDFCQNWELAQGDPREIEVTPLGLVNTAEKYKEYHDVIGLAYTYSEPLMWYEFVLDGSMLARKAGLKNVIVTNGFIKEEPLKKLLPHVDAVNIDVKGFNNEFYKKVVHGACEPVLRTAEIAKEHGCHVEITTLLIPGLNDSEEELTQLVNWVAESLGKDTPLHFSRYFPHYKLRLEPTPLETLQRAREIALKKLYYVYLGNVNDRTSSSTYCPSCKKAVITRTGFAVDIVGLANNNKCAHCGGEIHIVS